ncbi:MAG: hypothetical protein ACYC7D_07860 [Nitrososphaerales archaeon]
MQNTKNDQQVKRMKWKNLALGISVIAILILGVSLVFFSPRIYAFQETLQSSNPQWDGEGADGYYVNLNSTGGQNIAVFLSVFGQTSGNRSSAVLTPLQISISHAQGSQLDSLELNFVSSSLAPSVWFQVPEGYPSNPIELNQVNLHQETFKIPDFGFVGRGTISLSFMFNAPYETDQNYSFAIQVQMILHNTNTSITSLLGQKYTASFVIPLTMEPNSMVVLLQPKFTY